MKQRIFTALLFCYETPSFSFLSTCQAQVLKCYRKNPRVKVRETGLSVFLLNTTAVYLRLTLVVLCHTRGLGPRFRSTLPQGPDHLGPGTAGGDECIGGGTPCFIQSCRERFYFIGNSLDKPFHSKNRGKSSFLLVEHVREEN